MEEEKAIVAIPDIQEVANSSGNTDKCAKWYSETKKKYKLALVFDIVNLGLSVVCTALYIYSTYDPNLFISHSSFFWFNFFARIYFVSDFMINLSSVKSEKKLSFYFYIFLELLTSVPFIIVSFVKGMTTEYISDIDMITSSLVTLRIWRIEYLNIYIQSEVNRKLFTITCSVFSLLIFSTALINVVENTQTVGKYWLFLPRDCNFPDRCKLANDSFHSSFFFIMTAISTLGYFSNIYSVAGRIVIIGLIIISIIEIPAKSSELMTLLASKSIYSRTTYKKLEKVNFILITGNISYGSMLDLLQEYFHPDHGENERHALILMPQRPDPNMKSLLQEYHNKLFYFEGDPLKESDVKRCQFKEASTIIILCNKQTDDSNAEDSKTLLQAMAIRKYLTQDEEDAKTSNIKANDTKMLIQLLRPESELHFALSISKKNNSDQILCIDELKLSLLAKSCLCNGIIALVSNLIMTSNLENINENLMQKNEWLDEYKNGKGFEIYKIYLDNLRGYHFNEICEMIYNEKKIILFGLNIEAKSDGSCLVLLNPSDIYLPFNTDVIFYGYCLAENKSTADEVVIWSQGKKKPMYHRFTPDSKSIMTQFDRKSIFKRKQSNFEGAYEEEEEVTMEEKDNELYSADAITFSRICHITTEPIDKASVTLESIDNMLIARGHIIICGITHNFIDFIKPLRAKHLPKSECPAIVLLFKELPDEKLWSTIAFFDQIYLIQGDPMNQTDLKRAGIKFAKQVVILAPSIHEISQFTYNKQKNSTNGEEFLKHTTARKLTREEEDLLDSKTIFKYNMISKMKKDIFIIVELISPKNVAFLYNKGRSQNDEYIFIKANMNIDGTASFAAGEVYFSSIMDNLITQAYYNPSLLSVLKKLILGEDQSIYKKTPLTKFKDVVSSNLYLIDIPPMQKNNDTDYNTNTTSLRIDPENYIFLNNINHQKIYFKDVFHLLLKKKIVVIGVYRADTHTHRSYLKHNNPNNLDRDRFLNNNPDKASSGHSNFYYVVTSPEPNFKLNPRDKLFVLSQVYPTEELFLDSQTEKPLLIEDNFLKKYETNQFKIIKKNEEKKDNPRIFDQIGENKIKEVNINLRDTIDTLKELKNSINKVKDKIDKTLSQSVKGKIEALNMESRVSDTDR